MTYLLIIFILAVALAPLSHFVPSKRQRRIARMREYAAVHGMFVEFRDLPGAGDRRGRTAGPSGGDIIYYGKRMPPRRGEAVTPGRWLVDQEGWRSLDRRTAVPPELRELPTAVLAASVDGSSCGVYWREAGDEAQVEQIRGVLEAGSVVLLS